MNKSREKVLKMNVVNKSCEHKLLTKVMNKSCEHKPTTKVVNKNREQGCNKSVSWYLGYRTFLRENPDIFK